MITHNVTTDVVDPVDDTRNTQTAQNFFSLLLSFEGNWCAWGREDTNKVEWFGKFPGKKKSTDKTY